MYAKESVYEGIEIRCPRSVEPEYVTIELLALQELPRDHELLPRINDEMPQRVQKNYLNQKIRTQENQDREGVRMLVSEESFAGFGRLAQATP